MMTANKNAIVIKFDGLDGCGKTTLIEYLKVQLATKYSILITKEFGTEHDGIYSKTSMSISETIRQIAKSDKYYLDDVERELLWAFTSRRLNRLVIPRLINSYDIILVDRSNLSNLAYGITLEKKLKYLFDFANTPLEIYDIIFWIDTPIAICDKRLESKGKDIIEQKGIDFFYNVRKKFKGLIKNNNKVIVLDGRKNIEELLSDAVPIIETLLQK